MARVIKALGALVLAGASILGASSQASADPNPNVHDSNPQMATLITQYHAGVYSSPRADSKKIDGLILAPGQQAYVDCWVSGGTVGTTGDVWYRTSGIMVNGTYLDVYTSSGGPGWTYGPYVDGDQRFWMSPGGLPHC
ncbi:hypothetical protein ACIQCJ_03475 [Streptomyces sp. NPDC093221]|uniref:hypothetical protein n=1 Tax=Streptomyces sp. NPDC093221 TaxID=3366032 RepID=UPI0037F5256B